MKTVRLSGLIKEKDVLANFTRINIEDASETEVAKKIVEEVKADGDEAILRLIKEIEGHEFSVDELRVSQEEIKDAKKKVSLDYIAAIKDAYGRIFAFHENQLPKEWFIKDKGSTLGQLIRPLKRAGVYAPGGQASYPSSVLMGAIPAIVAKVAEIALCSPPDLEGQINPKTLVAADVCGIKEIYKIGGASAIAAMAYGTRSIKKVDKIVGPGNIYVTAAKKEVIGQVDIDMIAGPSEIVIIADSSANPVYVASDMLAQAEHAQDATAILITDSNDIAEKVKKELDDQLKQILRSKIASDSIRQRGRIFLVDGLDKAVEVANIIAPEHLEIMVEKATNYINQVQNAGAIFVGDFSVEALGDYIAGPNHVLPTMGTARFYSALSVECFIKKPSFLWISKEGFMDMAKSAKTIAEAEGLDAHSRSIAVREEVPPRRF
ncbi:MAG: histidinol dehydrogenase [Actinobacteria bacterium]|nr:MAG: histidinol dehydrogenase [Actinomycetota bacterium]